MELTAVFKDVATGSMSMESLKDALNDMEVHGVPGHARLQVNHYQQGGWEIKATWTPESAAAPVDPVAVAKQIQDRAWGIVPGLDPENVARNVRKLKDNPQA